MQLLIFYVFFCFLGGMILWKYGLSRRIMLLLGISAMIAFAYLFLNQL